ncbi:MAG: superoxide dismutase family protein [Anaerolineales bacterium]
MRKLMIFLVLFALAALVTSVYAANDGAERASAVLRDANGQEVGFARFTEDANGMVHVSVHVNGLAPGLHGIHVHAVGRCDLGLNPAFSTASGHHNPLSQGHGLDNPNGAHAGDLPNLIVNVAGAGRLNASTGRLTLSAGPTTAFDADGSALIIHAGADDQVTNPTGNSGGRAACGVIVGD